MASMEQYLNTRLIETVRVLDVEGLKRVINKHRANPTFHLDVDAALCLAARTGSHETVKQLLQAKASVSYTDREGNRALHYAAMSGSWKVVKAILNGGSPLNVPGKNGSTVLHVATESGNEEMVRMLLREGANTNRARLYNTNETPLHIACKSGHIEIPNLLISRGADVNVVSSEEGRTPLHYAIKAKHFHTVRVLCEKRADVDKKDKKGRTPLSVAVELGSYENTECLLQYGACPQLADCNGRTPLHVLSIAATSSTNQLSIARNLIELTASVNQRDSEGCTPLHHAAVSGNVDIAKLLISSGAELDIGDHIKGETPLNTAIANNRAEFAKLLIVAGSDVTLSDDYGLTPLHNVQGCRSELKLEITKLLIEREAKINVTTTRGDSPLDRCVFYSVLGNYNQEVLVSLVVAGSLLRPVQSRPQHQSPLCWLTWHNHFSSARFLVMVGWSLHKETWLNLPGKTPEAESFIDWLRDISHRPQQLTLMCRKVIRERLVEATFDTDISPAIYELPLPTFVKKQLSLEEEVRMLHAGDL